MKRIFLLLLTLSGCWAMPSLWSQETFPYNGVSDQREGLYAFTGATIYTTYQEKMENATLLIRDGKVEAVGAQVSIPKGAVVVPCSGKTIYPSFIDLYVEYGLPESKAESRSFRQTPPQELSNKTGAYAWNEALRPEFHAHEQFAPNEKTAVELRKLGFGAVLTHQMDGISRGTGAVVWLGDGKAHEQILQEQASHHLSFSKGSSSQNYPSSLMGCIALLRQTYYDAKWYAGPGKEEEVNLSLQAWNEIQSLPQIFEVDDALNALRACRLGQEFGVHYILKEGGKAYQRLDEIKKTGAPIIVPLNFPEAFDVEDPYDALRVDLADMKHWELAPANPARLAAAGIPIALTTNGQKKLGDFWTSLRKAIQYGLSEEEALKALTYTPANLVGIYDRVGSLEKGKSADFLIVSGDVFGADATIYQNWVKGKPFVLQSMEVPSWTAVYRLQVDDQEWMWHISGNPEKPDMKIVVNDTTEIKPNYKFEQGVLTLSFTAEKDKGAIRLSGTQAHGVWSGRGQLSDGSWVDWQAGPTRAIVDEEKKPEGKKEETPGALGAVTYPFTAYGWTERPEPGSYLIRNATVWTCEAEGVLENTDVLLENGKITRIGKNLPLKQGVMEIDGTGKHVTPGIIDEHSHIAISRGVNEGTQASSAEVRIGDVVNSDDINIYRQLSGGVTTSQLLHGSANPIGGQSALIKLRWGYEPEEMKFEGAAPFIKFALGENVKQSNWGDNARTRYPQTRMGVEQIYEDYFTRAREYGQLKRSGKPYRVDLEMEALLEILESKRFITCHSYRQSEINMLMKVAERFGFRVNTFTHILEGYKVADKMAEHGAGGSSFSDWWAYKFEVYEAIPYNGAIMHEQGVTVAFNSDDAEMARRLNQEAGKAVKYGGVPEEEALKFVTLNPAKLLHIDQRVGSIKAGKDADVVVWSDHPLSVYAVAEKTFVDGIKFFDVDEDLALRETVQKERARLIQKMLAEKKSGAKTQPGGRRFQYLYHCDDMEDEGK
ncbi:MAG: amidohydrolase family protein [Lewinellaceae bacterium]|nr:amidohydrolase family protein [Lewinellaceae bacterium]